MRIVGAMLACALAALACACSNSPSPPRQTVKPVARAGAAVGYDPATRSLLLIGGMQDPLHPPVAGDVPGTDFWAWSQGSGWRELTPQIVPPVTYLSSLVWDSTIARTVLVGGSDSSVWTWDGKQWAGAGALQPAMMALGGVTYDSMSNRVLILGRSADGGPDEVMWSWDGTAEPAEPTPMTWREQAVIAYDDASRQLVAYGGYGDSDTRTWLYDDTSWAVASAAGGPFAGQSSAVYDPVHRQVVAFVLGSTWTWDGAAWSIRSTRGPGIRRDQAMAFDPVIGKVVLFGGKVPKGSDEQFMNDLWAWDGTSWIRIG